MTTPTIPDARMALIKLESDIRALVAEYEDHYDLSVQSIDLTHGLVIGYPKRVMRVLAKVEL